MESAQAQALSIDGVEYASVDAGGSYSGFTRSSGVLLTLRLSPGFRVARADRLSEFLVRLAWSVNTEKPNDYIAMKVDGLPNSNLVAGFREAGWHVDWDPEPYLIDIPPQTIGEKLGRWPGPVPKVPDGMIVPETPAQAETGFLGP
jgi:hypothetical protein